jgi:hypothetical protein
MWKSERMCAIMYRASGNALTGVAAENFHTLRAGLRIGRNVGDANSQLTESSLQDFSCEDGSTGAWFSTELDTESPVLTIDLTRFNLRSYDIRDGLERCLDPYPGITTFYHVNDEIRLWDMSLPSTLSFIRTFLNSTSEAEALDACFRYDAEHEMVVRHSTLKEDVALCRILVNRGLFTAQVPGWYQPTMCVFNEEDMRNDGVLRLERIHRREIVLMNPLELIRRLRRATPEELGVAGVAAPKKPPRSPSIAATADPKKLLFA